MKGIGALREMRLLMLLLVFLAGYTADGDAQEIAVPDSLSHYWTGRVEQDTTWRDTIYVGGDVTIASGVTLTLAPDTKAFFLPYRDDTQGGLDSTRAKRVVAGRLNAQAGGIVFGSADTASLGTDWYGLVVQEGSIADVSNATIRDGLCCVDAATGGLVTIDHVAFANCGKPTGVSQNSTGPLKVKEKEEEDDRRIGRKLVGGVLGGVGGGLAGAAIMLWGDRGDFGDALPALLGFWGGNLVGTPVGVSAVDPQDNFLITLVGSALAGVGVPAAILFMTANDENDSDAIFILSGLLGPIVGSTIASEVWRKPLSAKPHLKPEAFRISVGLVQDLKGGLSAIARLRF